MAFLLKAILVLLGIYYILRWAVRTFLPGWMLSQLKKMNQTGVNNQFNEGNAAQREGDITIHAPKRPSKNSDNEDIGEYTDFEEVKDK